MHTCSERSESCMRHLGLEVCNLGVQKGHGEPVNHFVNSRIKAFLFSSLEVGGGHECPTRCFHRCTLMLEDEARPRFSSATAGANYGRSTMPHHTRPLPCTRLRQAGRACTPVHQWNAARGGLALPETASLLLKNGNTIPSCQVLVAGCAAAAAVAGERAVRYFEPFPVSDLVFGSASCAGWLCSGLPHPRAPNTTASISG